MSAKIEIISEGYSRWHSRPNWMYAKGSSTLIRANNLNVVFDTLGPWDRQLIIDKLTLFGLTPDDISRLVCSHTHPDHIGNNNLFTNCQHIVGHNVYERDLYQLNAFQSNKVMDISKDMQIVSTPGHTLEDITLIVKNVDKLGTVGITGDLFECEDDLKDDSIWRDAGSDDQRLQSENRELILQLCDYIVPGHGIGFKVNK